MRPTKIVLSAFALAAGFGLVVASAADAAKSRKHKRVGAPSAYSVSGPAYEGNSVYIGNLYMGSDPDPNIRGWFRKDLSGRWGGSY